MTWTSFLLLVFLLSLGGKSLGEGSELRADEVNEFTRFLLEKSHSNIDEDTSGQYEDIARRKDGPPKGKKRVECQEAHGNRLLKMPLVCTAYLSERCARRWLSVYNRVSAHNANIASKLNFAYSVDMTKAKLDRRTKLQIKIGSWAWKVHQEASKFRTAHFSPDIRRQFQQLTMTAQSKDSRVRKQLAQLMSNMSYIYGHARACPAQMKCLEVGEIGVENFMRTNRDYDQLAAVWKAWHDATGPLLKPDFVEMVRLLNVGAKANGYSDYGYFEWFSDTEDLTFNQEVMRLYSQFLPLYQQLHAYVRHRLLQKYPGRFPADGPIPAHLFGNPWAQQWFNIIDLVQPYPDVALPDATPQLQAWRKSGKLNYRGMFRIAEEFFTSLGLPPMTPLFWKRSMLSKPKHRVANCHASASSFSNKCDFRIKMCTQFSQNQLTTIHHEMGHVEYYMAYASQPQVYKAGANSGFHEAIGDTVALSVNTPDHLHKINLIGKVPTGKKFDINYLMRVALEKVAFIPFGLVTDVWRWRAFNGSSTPDTYNRDWWHLRSQLQGLSPPLSRTSHDCDPLAKYHIAVNVPYIRYFMSFIMQFQFYKSLCEARGYRGPLHRCDFYQSLAAGRRLHSMLAMGSSKPWPEAMRRMTGQSKIRTDAILEYFKPLHDWLVEENKKNKVYIGWKVGKLPVQ